MPKEQPPKFLLQKTFRDEPIKSGAEVTFNPTISRKEANRILRNLYRQLPLLKAWSEMPKREVPESEQQITE